MARKSGRYWVTWATAHAANSTLEPVFRARVKAFIEALRASGTTMTISATSRHAMRAYLFHWAWMIAQGKCIPADPASLDGVDTEWDHGDLAHSIAAAREMVGGFGLASPPASVNPPALASSHISGTAIDMTITWHGTPRIKKADGTEVDVPYQRIPEQQRQAAGSRCIVRRLQTQD